MPVYQFVPTRHKGRSKQEKLLAVCICAHAYSFRTIAKFFKVNVLLGENICKNSGISKFVYMQANDLIKSKNEKG